MTTAVAVDAESSPEPDETGVASWDALVTGTARELLIERLAQAHLIRDAEPPPER